MAYPRDRIVSASREMSSSNWTSWTPRVSIREVKTPCGEIVLVAAAALDVALKTYLVGLDGAPATCISHLVSS